MIDREHRFVNHQAGRGSGTLSRGSVYYLPRPVSANDLEVMRRLDRLHLQFLSRLAHVARPAGRRGVQRSAAGAMRENADEADGDRGALSPSANDEASSPVTRSIRICCATLAITRPNQVWAMDITYIPMARGFVYLAVVLDWFSRRLRHGGGCRITMEAKASRRRTLEDALAHHGKPEIVNTDQGSQFTGSAFTGVLTKCQSIAISSYGWQRRLAGQCLRRAGYGAPSNTRRYICSARASSEARASIGRYLHFYNERRLACEP